MSADIVERLRETAGDVYVPAEVSYECDQAADEITRLRGLLEQATEALEKSHDALDMWASGKAMSRADVWKVTRTALNGIRATLAGEAK